MNFRFLFGSSVLAVALTISSAGTAYGDSLVLTSQTGGQYNYGLQLDANHGLVISVGDRILLTGLFGVTGASVSPALNFAYSNVVTTPTSVSITDTTGFVLDPLAVSQIVPALQVSSSVSNTGSINYQVVTGSEGTLSGTALGPVALVPEPAELPGTVTAMAAFLALQWKRRNAFRRSTAA